MAKPGKLKIRAIIPTEEAVIPDGARRVNVVVVATLPDGSVVRGAAAQRLLDWNMHDRETPIDQRPRFHYVRVTDEPPSEWAAGETWLIPKSR